MKREGRQHGVVSCYEILPGSLSQQRFVKMVDSASTMGLFTKVPTKPTNQSKYTGKCRRPRCNRCHIHPVCKSKDKAKGTMKLRSIDTENELTKYSFGTSATGVLAYLADDGGYDNDNDDYDYDDRVEENSDYSYGYDYANDHRYNYDGTCDIDLQVGFGIGIGIGIVSSIVADEHEKDVDVDELDDDDDDDNDTMSFCDIGSCWGDEDGDEYEDDDWYMVNGQMH